MQRIIIAYNPRSSKQAKIEKEVIRPLQKMGGYQVGKFEVARALVDENAARLAAILQDGDLLITAGGDGTSTVGLNAAMIAKKDVTLGVLGYGNFNDFSRTLGITSLEKLLFAFENGSTMRLVPLDAWLDGKHWRYAACYFTVGMFAESTAAFEEPEVRTKLKKGIFKGGFSRFIFSIFTLAKWYFRNHIRAFLPKDIQLNDVPMNRMKMAQSGRVNEVVVPEKKRVSDVMFVNGKTVAKIMRGGEYWMNPEEYFVSFGRLKGLMRLVGFMMQSIFRHLPGKVVKAETKIDFSGPEEFEIQAEGEYLRVKAKELIVKKSEHGVKVVCRP